MTKQIKSRVLITGSSGFIGKSLVARLLKDGLRELTLLDLNQKRFVRGGVVGMKGSFGDSVLMKKVLPGHDRIFHLGAMVGVERTLGDQNELKNVNLVQTKKFIDLAARYGINKVAFTSSSEVYGNSKCIPFREDGPVDPVSHYARYKIAIEDHLSGLARAGKMESTVVRFFNVYGPGQRKDFVINRFLDRAQKGKDLLLNWDGTQTRSFTFIDDAVGGLLSAMEYNQTPFDIFNIGNDYEVSIYDLAKLTINLTRSHQSNIVVLNKSKISRYDVSRRVPSIEKARRMLGYVPNVSLDEGLRNILHGR